MILPKKVKHLLRFMYPVIRLWTTESYERIPWQKTKYVWIGQPYHEAA